MLDKSLADRQDIDDKNSKNQLTQQVAASASYSASRQQLTQQ
jgi:hypothetical protein